MVTVPLCTAVHTKKERFFGHFSVTVCLYGYKNSRCRERHNNRLQQI